MRGGAFPGPVATLAHAAKDALSISHAPSAPVVPDAHGASSDEAVTAPSPSLEGSS